MLHYEACSVVAITGSATRWVFTPSLLRGTGAITLIPSPVSTASSSQSPTLEIPLELQDLPSWEWTKEGSTAVGDIVFRQ